MPIPSTLPEPRQRVLLRDMVRARIRDAILDGTLQPGEDLHDEELQNWLGVSRTPIRDAINELARMGLIDMAPNRYTRVAVPVDEETISTFHTVALVLGGAVRLAVPRLTPEERQEIADEIDDLNGQLTVLPWEDLRRRVLPFFSLYVEKTGNVPYQQLCADSLDGLAFRTRTRLMPDIVDLDSISEALLALRDATLAGDAVAAQRITERGFRLEA